MVLLRSVGFPFLVSIVLICVSCGPPESPAVSCGLLRFSGRPDRHITLRRSRKSRIIRLPKPANDNTNTYVKLYPNHRPRPALILRIYTLCSAIRLLSYSSAVSAISIGEFGDDDSTTYNNYKRAQGEHDLYN